MKRRKVRLKAHCNIKKEDNNMSEGTPSILDIIAPGQTGLSGEKWVAILEMYGRRVRSMMDRTSLPTLSAFLAEENNLDNAEALLVQEDHLFYLRKQGLYFSSTVLSSHGIWYVWGVCREDALWSLTRFELKGEHGGPKVLTLLPQKACPQQIMETICWWDGEVLSYLILCEKLASFADRSVERQKDSLYKSLVRQAQFKSELDLLRSLERQKVS